MDVNRDFRPMKVYVLRRVRYVTKSMFNVRNFCGVCVFGLNDAYQFVHFP